MRRAAIDRALLVVLSPLARLGDPVHADVADLLQNWVVFRLRRLLAVQSQRLHVVDEAEVLGPAAVEF